MLGAFDLGDNDYNIDEENFDNDDDDDNVEKDFDPNNKDPMYRLCLTDDQSGKSINIFRASEKGRLDLMKKFYHLNPEIINSKDSDGYTPLHRACSTNQIDIVKWLIRHGANVRATTNDGWQPIHSAAQWGRTEILRILLAYGANINAQTNGGNTPFHLAATRSNLNQKLIEYLLFHPDVDLSLKNDANDTVYDICKRNSMLYRLWDLL